ncbi:hypothetical protein BS78_03G082900 [Paspalum vaginatum]|nr:hypothetical protein BS78_03G082900 [Paspalum vaginatum]
MRVEEAPMDHAEPEVEKLEEDEATLVPVEDAAAAGVEITVRIAKAKLHCPVCTLPLKPPICQCAFGHLACGACGVQFPGTVRCYGCGHAGGYVASTAVEDFVRSAKILCPYDAHGCRSYVAYYHVPEHQRACPHAPCLCSEPGRAARPPPGRALVARGRAASEPGQHRRVVVAGDDGAVFLLAVGALGDGPVRFVSLVCARPGGAAAAGPRAAPGKVSVEEAASLVVLRRMLHGTAAEEIHVGILISKIV